VRRWPSPPGERRVRTRSRAASDLTRGSKGKTAERDGQKKGKNGEAPKGPGATPGGWCVCKSPGCERPATATTRPKVCGRVRKSFLTDALNKRAERKAEQSRGHAAQIWDLDCSSSSREGTDRQTLQGAHTCSSEQSRASE
jgi:hypothetical protein